MQRRGKIRCACAKKGEKWAKIDEKVTINCKYGKKYGELSNTVGL